MAKKQKSKIVFDKNMIIILLIAAIVLLGGFFIYRLFVETKGTPVYGNRLDSQVKIEDTVLTQAKETIEKTNLTDKVNLRIQGKVIYVEVNVIKEVNVEQAEGMFTDFFKAFTTEQLEAYDFQFLVTKTAEEVKEGEKDYFPHFGSKPAQNKTNEIKWQERYQYTPPKNEESDSGTDASGTSDEGTDAGGTSTEGTGE